MENKGEVVSRDNLMRRLWNDDIYVNENTLTVNINRLRNRLEGINVYDFILTKRNGIYNSMKLSDYAKIIDYGFYVVYLF